MTSPAPAPKRRRLDASTSALHKPFRSPLKTAHPTVPTTPARAPNPLNTSCTPSNLSSTLNSTSANTPSAQTPAPTKPAVATANPTPHNSAAATKTPLRSKYSASHATLKPRTNISSSPEHHALRQEIKNLDLRARTLRNQIDVLTASNTPTSSASSTTSSSSPQQTRLQTLTAKWRLASQQAAEVLYADVATRIKDNGGMSAYRRSERERALESSAWFAGEPASLSTGAAQAKADGEEEERSLVRRYGGVARTAGEEIAEWEEEEEEFGMEQMCLMLGIEVGVIGWDCSGQKWVG